MTREDVKFDKLPEAPGVYFFMGKRREILYIGKATSLRDRVRSYFSSDIAEVRSPLIAQMIAEAVRIETTPTDSVLEALLLETNLIRTHKPKYNTLSKDDKSYNHLIITNEEFPRVLVVRGKDLSSYPEDTRLHTFGPFPQGTLFKEALKIVRELFQFYDDRAKLGSGSSYRRGVVSFNRQIGLYPKDVDRDVYLQTVRHLALFFEGKKEVILRELEQEMLRLAKLQKFEEAAQVKRKIFALTHIHDVALMKKEFRTYHDEKRMRVEGYDVAHLQGEAMVGVMTVCEGGEPVPSEYRSFTIRSLTASNDPAALREVLSRRLEHPEWHYPHVIVVDGSTAQKNAAEKVLREAGVVIPVVGVVKDEHHKPKRLIGPANVIRQHHDTIIRVNAEAHRFSISLHRKKLRTERTKK
ncbi:hypothetical protein A3C89_01970 [Candidatus Kaiserbacteria bacterium RIFCSPHIGHO2_02_FULL_50_50]|uniref:Excinuclease ABC subunit C n=1 Tax=Candidatus Kaiserbacteria bacterium RIFCSPHIGHO2_02_FULL_50_50 TaxID=1798492 RepID=A0A1F6DDN5_9BACT|nr:MAG: hypothetical protein A3C89_01970 [Candidatus Kaiserbacteria bacterium RIFCSPHIGHO2_02_FULL_50_50]OGG88781.1 MAG: hypothetical protein A3G62_03725 [Candidatus Kaiserbacteria bacterium RIFCSPLOWO2_12_FULL_50_10]